MTRIRTDLRKPPLPAAKAKQRISRQRRRRLDRDSEYLVIRDIYLEENPICANCQGQATEVHHIVSGAAGRARSLLNQNTWLGVCRTCHEELEGLPELAQVIIKIADVAAAIRRTLTLPAGPG